MQATPFTIETNPTPHDLQFLEDRINEHNMTVTGYHDFQWLTIFVRDETQMIVAGLVGYTWGQSCKIQSLWVQPALRGQRYGKALLQAAEAEAAQRGCHTVVLDTHSFQAPTFYEKLGYTAVGVYKVSDLSNLHRPPSPGAEFGLFAPLATALADSGCAICLLEEVEGEQ